MRILAINWQDRKNPLAGGAEVHLHEILSRLGAQGHNITLLCSGFPGAPREESYDHLRIIRRGRRATFNWVVPRWTRRLLRETPCDVVIDDINKIPFYTPRLIDRPILAIVHHLFGAAIFREVNPVAASYVYFAERLVPRIYRRTAMMVVSESTRNDLVRRGMNPARLRVVHNGIDPRRYCPDPTVPKSSDPSIVYVGRLKRYKAIDHLLAAVARLQGDFPRLAIQIVGAGDDQPRLRSVAQRLSVAGRVDFTGFVDFERKTDILRRAWVAVCPSLKEGWGLTNIEANGCGTPVVCADVPGLRDSVRDGQTGLLYPYGDIDALTERLRCILSDNALRLRLAAGGLEWARRFSWDEAARQTEEILTRVASGETAISSGSGCGTTGGHPANGSMGAPGCDARPSSAR